MYIIDLLYVILWLLSQSAPKSTKAFLAFTKIQEASVVLLNQIHEIPNPSNFSLKIALREARQTSFDVSWIVEVFPSKEREVNSKLGPSRQMGSPTAEQILPCWRPPCSNLLPGCQSGKETPATPWVQLSSHPTSSHFYHYQMVRLLLRKHWEESPAEALLKIGGTAFLELFRSVSWKENKTKEILLHVPASLSGVTWYHCAF